MKLRLLIIVLLGSFEILSLTPLKAQVNLDSLLTIANNQTEPTKKCDAYITYLGKLGNIERDSAIQLLIESENNYTKSGFVYGLGRAKSLRGWLLMYKAQFEASLKLGHEALIYQTKINDSIGIASTLNRIGVANLRFERFVDAEKYLGRAYKYATALNDTVRIDQILNNFGAMYAQQNMHTKAVYYYQKCLDIRVAQKQYYWIGYAYYNIGSSFLGNGDLDSAKYYLLLAHKTFTEKSEKKKDPPMVSMGIGQCYYALKDYTSALKYTQIGIEDAIKIDQTELLTEGKEYLYKILYKQGKYKEAFEAQQDYLLLKNNVDSINNSANVAEVEGKYKTAEKEAEIAKLETLKLDAENKVQTFRVYGISSVAIVLLLASAFVLVNQRRNQIQKLQQADLTTKIAEAKMFALRAQMNPHFIFNCINTAQHFVINNNKEQAYEYLANFAKLLRLVMENSSHTYVPIEDEIKQIELYANLESIRFEQKFNYTIFVDPALKNGVFEIPAMILQPLVENAIGHGLMNRNDALGELKINLTLENESILCEVLDNGIGRNKAMEIKKAKKTSYASAAIPNINERLLLLGIETGKQIELVISDVNPGDVYPGTKASLRLPFQ